MLEYWESIVLAIVQGLTEFIPVSSSGHLTLGQKLLLDIDPALLDFFDVFVHVGTLLAIVLVLRRQTIDLVAGCFGIVAWLFKRTGRLNDDPQRHLAAMVIVATIPTVIIGLVFKKRFGETNLYGLVKDNLPLLAAGWIFTGVWLMTAGRRTRGMRGLAELKMFDMVLLGIFQGLAIWPGISRSGSTIGLLLLRRTERETAGKLAFVVAIPAIIGAFALEVYDVATSDIIHDPDAIASIGPMIAGGVAAFFTGILALKLLLRIVQHGKLQYFACYCWALAALSLVVWAAGWGR